MASRPTASIIIIGDEILKGQTKDTNSHFLCRELYKCGVKVPCISVIPDEIDVIAEEVLLHSKKYSFVLTSGGIGPTHDDVTYEGVAKAFKEKLVLNKDLQKILKKLCRRIGLDSRAAFKMSHVPESSEIHHTSNEMNQAFLPIVSVKNVFIFPGIPSYLEYAFIHLKPIFCTTATNFFTQNLFVTLDEFSITDILNAAVKEYENRVKFGSYPEIGNEYYQVKLTLEADSKEAVAEAEAFLRSHLPHNTVVGQYSPNSDEALQKFLNICDKEPDIDFIKAIEASNAVLQECVNLYKVEGICLSFNGGKDCTALLHLTHLFLAKTFPTKSVRLRVLYVQSKQSFPEIEEFIQLCVQRYNLDLLTYNQPIKEALHKLQIEHPYIKAVLMGSRRTDPHCSDLKSFHMTDDDWPQFMRVSPLINWSYPQVWTFLRSLEVPYCSLYDRGYTSLGCKHNTLPNDNLMHSTKDGKTYYLPAYLLKNPEEEREGRSGCRP
ncbi:FAD synthase-like isoform X2 [Stegodyphus dumicola]|nr:FAD synthase-like isoform X2 [Stegodyphus dumicola]XP_035227526.1 FAD synthase-like isoform X2 [Stegodyphus dumicola]